jgi:hypothetical protein
VHGFTKRFRGNAADKVVREMAPRTRPCLRQMRTFAPGMAMYKYTEQTTIQWAIPGLLRGPGNGQITARRPAVLYAGPGRPVWLAARTEQGVMWCQGVLDYPPHRPMFRLREAPQRRSGQDRGCCRRCRDPARAHWLGGGSWASAGRAHRSERLGQDHQELAAPAAHRRLPTEAGNE